MPAYYRATFQEFQSHSDTEIVGIMAVVNRQSRFPLEPEQIDAWLLQLPALRNCVEALIARFDQPSWSVLLEYPIPLLGDRLDCALLCGGVIVVVEFKSGELSSSAARRQAEDYAANLANFHEGSAGRAIQTVVAAGQHLPLKKFRYSIVAGHNELGLAVLEALASHEEALGQSIDATDWDRSRFKPIPPIINAAVQLYEHKDVFAIEHACAPAESLTNATNAIVRVVADAQSHHPKSICFVTGVPGAGKTLVGLNAVHHPDIQSSSTFLSGNGPLIDVIREALLRDARKRRGLTSAAALPEINAFIHSVHRFAELFVDNDMVPIQATLVFDEAQRAWNRERNLKRFQRDISEPEMLLQIMDRRDRATIVALVGGGQEINAGEAGLAEWGRALQRFPDWHIHASPEVLKGGSATAGFRLFETVEAPLNNISIAPELHLQTNVRSIRGKFIAEWVNHLLEANLEKAAACATSSSFKVTVTRSLSDLRTALRKARKGNETAGLVGSAHAAGLRADGLEYSFPFHKGFDWENWFLDSEEDVRSCNRLEVFATQFEVQGLELDWVGVCWGEDFVFDDNCWRSKKFNYKKWKEEKSSIKHFFKTNAYRVLLTRARQGMTIFVPQADPADAARLAAGLDKTYQALLQAGAVPLQ